MVKTVVFVTIKHNNHNSKVFPNKGSSHKEQCSPHNSGLIILLINYVLQNIKSVLCVQHCILLPISLVHRIKKNRLYILYFYPIIMMNS